jgi:hypothetical protein
VRARLSKESRLPALRQLLDYAREESKDLGLADLDKLLGAAVLAVSDKLDKVKTLSRQTDASRNRPPSKP